MKQPESIATYKIESIGGCIPKAGIMIYMCSIAIAIDMQVR